MSVSVLRASLRRVAESNVGSASYHIQSSCYSTGNENLNLTAWKRGTGGRSSFNGVVATVFGCTGFVGHYLCSQLGRTGSQMILPYRSDFYNCMDYKPMGDLGQVLFTKFDIRDEKSVEKAVKYSNVVFNLIGRDYQTKNFTYDDANVKSARMIARVCKRVGVERLIHLSYLNSGDDPEPLILSKPSGYKTSKWFGELAVREEFPDATIIKASDIYGSNDRFLRVLCSWPRRQIDLIPLYRNGEFTEKQPVFASDVARAMINAAKDSDTRGQVYQAVGPKRYQFRDMMRWFYQILRRDRLMFHYFYDMKYDPFFKLRVKMMESLSPGYPLFNLHLEGLEKEATSDVILPNVPMLEDLGVTPTEMEKQVPWELAVYKQFAYYNTTLGEEEFTVPVPPTPIVAGTH